MLLQSKAVQYGFLFITLTTTLVLVALVFGKMQAFEVNSDSYRRGQSAVSSWKANYVEQLTITNSATCPTDSFPIHSFQWPGNAQICACPFTEGVGSYFNLKEGACSTNDLANSCTNHAANNPQDLLLWKGGNKICAKKSATNNLLNENIACPTATHKYCGSGESKVCVPTADSCPITYAAVQFGNSANGSLLINQVDTGEYLVRGNLDNHFPITGFQVQVKRNCNPWCTGKDSNYVKRFSFAKSQVNVIGADIVGPSNVQVVDSQGERDYYNNNNLLASISGLPGHPRVSNDLNIQLAAVKALEWKHKCRSDEGYTLEILKERLSLDEEQAIFIATFAVVFFTWFLILVIVPLKQYYAEGKVDTTNILCIICRTVQTILKLATLALVILGLYVSHRGYIFFRDAMSKGCTSAYGDSSILDDYKWTHQVHLIYFCVALGAISLVILFDILHLAKEWKDKLDAKKDKGTDGAQAQAQPKKAKAKAAQKKQEAQPVEVEMTEVGGQETEVQIQTNIENEGENLQAAPAGTQDQDFLDKCVENVRNIFN